MVRTMESINAKNKCFNGKHLLLKNILVKEFCHLESIRWGLKNLTEIMLQKHLSFNVLFPFPKQLNSLAFNLL